MAMPDYQAIMRPLLERAEQRGERHLRLHIDELAEYFALTDAERAEMLPSGAQSRFVNRVNWAASYLTRAGMLERPTRGTYRIAELGRWALENAPTPITGVWLEPYIERHTRNGPGPAGKTAKGKGSTSGPGEKTPEEQLELTYQALREVLAAELLDLIMQRSPTFFEHLVVDLLVAMGYGGSLADAGRAIGKTGDGGIDGIIKEDRLGLDFIYIQAKRWEGVVGSPAVQAFAGSLQGHHARKGVFITTSTYSQAARDFAAKINTRIVLIDGQELAQLMIDHGVGVATVTTYAVKRVDAEYFEG